MSQPDNTFISARDLSFKGVLYDIKKSKSVLQPIFEAFTNALEAIKIKSDLEPAFKGKVEITFYANESTVQSSEFASLTISDNGIGFNDKEFTRFNTFKDSTKGFKNIGSGRIQYVHHFDKTSIHSIFKQDNKYFEREFVVSKKIEFLDQNSIVLHKFCKEVQEQDTGTSLTFYTLLESSNIYNNLDANSLKGQLLKRYVHYFCYNKSTLPEINIKFYVHSKLKGETIIDKTDIPPIDKADNFPLQYSRISSNGKSVEKSDKTEVFNIDAFKVKDSILENNDLKLVSKGEIVEESDVILQSLPKGEHVNGYKYLFLVSSEYIDLRDTDMRGALSIPHQDSFTKNTSMFSPEEIFLEEIQEGVNIKINTMYPEIEETKHLHDEQLDKLKEMFLLDDETAKSITISINDSESKILEKFYEAEAKKTASIDASIKESIDNLDKLDTTSPNYNEDLKKEIDKLSKAIPFQNRKALTQYVARRSLLLDLFDKILNKKLVVQQQKDNFDEALIHNLLFQQGSEDPESSDLWMINEDFIYFKGSSEKPLSKVEINGERLFKDKFSEEEERYLSSLGENRKNKRPDVLLFPDEGKCIIIEFKSPEVNASEHLTQIDYYANLIRNYTEDKFQITTFYGFLLGESIEPRDVLGRVTRYEESYQFDYLYRPAEKVVGFDERTHGSIYTEVIKYSTLLARARRRNKVFTEKLTQANNKISGLSAL